ncbi:hypothetical protein [Acidipropionibacterium acidipropionici]|uniref:hypothetical protein n=1 Tax=Acidipropionibacterium acidipropionici TaxID=1748 RepID=UPI000AFF5656|nr:hypothetical protein [Acidipropionibacterium acidipropionici]
MADFDSVTVRIDAGGVTVEVHRDGQTTVEDVTPDMPADGAPVAPSPRSASEL